MTSRVNARLFLSPPHLSGEELEFVQAAFASNYIAPLGPMVDAFEREFGDYVGIPHCLALASGTSAMQLAMRELGVGPGEEVLASTLTFIGSVSPAIHLGAVAAFIDSDARTWNMDADLLAEELAACDRRGKLPKVVIPTDLYGQCADLQLIKAICDRYGVPVISDAAEAMGALYRDHASAKVGKQKAESGKRRTGDGETVDGASADCGLWTVDCGRTPGWRHAGAGARAGVFSFNGNKIMTTSGGGMLASADEGLIAHARKLSQQARDPAPHYQHSEIGYNSRMSNILAAIGRAQLKALDERVERKRQIFEAYRMLLADLPGIEFMPEASCVRCNRWLTVVLIHPEEFGATTQDVRIALESENIESRPIWKPMHLQPVFLGCRIRGGTVSEHLFRRGLCLPSGTAMTDGDVERVAGLLRRLAGVTVGRYVAASVAGERARLGADGAGRASDNRAQTTDHRTRDGAGWSTGDRSRDCVATDHRTTGPRTAQLMKIPFARVACDGNELKYVREVLESGWLTSAGKTFEFERRFAEATGARHACAVNSCTAALHLALEAIGVGPGDKVLVPTLTFTATAEVIRYLGADPVFLDADYGTGLLTPGIVEEALMRHSGVKAVMVVHLGGQAARMTEDGPQSTVHSPQSTGILEVCRRRRVRVVEDAAHAFPTRLNGRMLGTFGDATCFSFYANKTITTGEGGMLVTDDEAIYARVKTMRLHGINRDIWDRFTSQDSPWEYDVVAPGFKYNMPDINAAIGLAQLERAEPLRRQRQRCFEYYFKHLAGLDDIDLPVIRGSLEDHSCHLFWIVLRETGVRNRVIEMLDEAGIGTSVHYRPMHRMTYYRDRYGLRPEDFPNAERHWRGCMSLPVYPGLTEPELAYVVKQVRRCVGASVRRGDGASE